MQDDDDANANDANDDGQFMIVLGSLVDKPNESKIISNAHDKCDKVRDMK